MGRMYFGLGILATPDYYEVSRKDLVGEHIGTTEAKTGAWLAKAQGGVLFVDEAPELYKPDNDRDFGRLALDVIMKFAEDHRDDTMIALAGYADAMDLLLSANPGLRSRFPTQLEFPSYTPVELSQIAQLMADTSRVLLHPAAAATFRDVTEWLATTAPVNPRDPAELLIDVAGNGRYVRNVMSEAVVRMKARLVAEASIDLATIELDSARTVTNADMREALTDVLASAGITLSR